VYRDGDGNGDDEAKVCSAQLFLHSHLLFVPSQRDSRSHLHRDPWDTYPPAFVVHVGIPEVWQLHFLLVNGFTTYANIYTNICIYIYYIIKRSTSRKTLISWRLWETYHVNPRLCSSCESRFPRKYFLFDCSSPRVDKKAPHLKVRSRIWIGLPTICGLLVNQSRMSGAQTKIKSASQLYFIIFYDWLRTGFWPKSNLGSLFFVFGLFWLLFCN